MSHDPQQTPAPSHPPVEPQTVHVINSKDLLKGHTEVLIRHAGEIYRLRVTKNDKLILQK